MKKLSLLLSVVATIFIACEPENEPNPSVEGVSRVVSVSYPTVELIGDPIIHIPIGGTFVDPGATLTDDITGAVSTIMATGFDDLDVTKPGLYAIDYEARNSNGFLASATRTVFVFDYTPPANLDPNFDISGQYIRGAVVCTITKFDNGLYVTDNVGGSTFNPAYLVTPDTVSFDIPYQRSYHGLLLEGVDEIYLPGPPTQLKYRVLADGYGTQQRTFTKQ